MTITGFLDNLSYAQQSKEYCEKIRQNTALFRKYQNDLLEGIFKEKNIPCEGPAITQRFPVGGWFFKLGPASTGDLKKYVLSQLVMDDSLTKTLPGYEDFTISLGILVRDCPIDRNPGAIDFYGGCEMDFTAFLSAFQRQRRDEHNKPYFLVVDAAFRERFPINRELDSMF